MKTTIKIVAVSLAILLPFLAVFTVPHILPPVYENNFVGALDEKFERLTSMEEEKIVIVGGSSVAFGYDSALMETYMGMPVVNFGLYAALGTKVMMDLSRAGIGEGDIVLLAPELDAQTLSLYFNAETTLIAAESDPMMLRYVRGDDTLSLLGAVWNYGADKIERLLADQISDPQGVYHSKNFNEYGDLEYERTENIMKGYYDTNVMINLSPEILSEAFAQYVNEYVSFCEKRGATVYFAYCPMNERGITENSDPQALSEALARELDCTVIGNIDDYILPAGYFYDTNFHLNDKGVTRHTVTMIKALLLELGIPTRVNEPIPEAPELPNADYLYQGEDENAKYFTYELTDAGLRITGLTDLGKGQKTLTLPIGHDGYKVTRLGRGALSGGMVETLLIPEESAVYSLDNGAFEGAGTLRDLVIGIQDQRSITPPESFVGTAGGFRVHVPSGSDYDVGYFWSERQLTFVFDAEDFLS